MTRAARSLGLDFGTTNSVAALASGGTSDMVLLDAENTMDALVRTPPRDAVITVGRLLVG